MERREDPILSKIKTKLIRYNQEYLKTTNETDSYVVDFRCPRCGEVHLPAESALAATSTISDEVIRIKICNECAVADRGSLIEDIPFWAIAEEDFH